MSDQLVDAQRARRILTAHLYTTQLDDLCHQVTPVGGQTWADLAVDRAEHLVELLEAGGV